MMTYYIYQNVTDDVLSILTVYFLWYLYINLIFEGFSKLMDNVLRFARLGNW